MCFCETDIMLPKKSGDPGFMQKWSVVACDQYTSDISYWNKIKECVGTSISSLNLIIPEIYLETETESSIGERIKNISEAMRAYEKDLVCCKDSMFYIERTLKNGRVRRGILGAVDLEEYDYKKGSGAKIRSTEETVASRIPPRVKIRENALFELPHIMILYDDEKDILISELGKNSGNFEKVYDFELMQGSGRIAGYKLGEKNISFVKTALESFETDGFLFAVGDGNHSLATAKEYWETVKKTLPPSEASRHPARYALAEIVNIYDKSLEFEPIYRILFGVDPADVIKKLNECYGQDANGHTFEIYYGENRYAASVKSGYNLPVKTLQIFLDDYVQKYGGRIDYIHGRAETIEFAGQKGAIGFIFDTMKKSDLFSAVRKDGALPRKTFSMGEADDKRFYLECRRII